MKTLSSRASTVGIFVAATVLLIGCLLAIRWSVYLPVALFWLAVILMIGTVVYQCFKFRLSSGYAGVVLAEIAIAAVAFHLIYQIPYFGLRGSDAYSDLAASRIIIASGYVMGSAVDTGGTGPWPMIHVLGAQLAQLTGVELFTIAKWFPSFMAAALIPVLFMLVRNSFKDEKVALLAALLYACLQQYILFGSLFIRETIAVVLMIYCLYLYFSGQSSRHPVACYALAVMCLIGTTFAHHFTSLMLAGFLLVHFIVGKATDLPAVKQRCPPSGVTGQRVGSIFLLLAFICPIAFWAGGGVPPPNVTAAAILEPRGMTHGIGMQHVATSEAREPTKTDNTSRVDDTARTMPATARVTGVADESEGSIALPVSAEPGEPLELIARFLQSVFSPGRWGSAFAEITGMSFREIQTVRGVVIFIGFWFLIAAFGIALLRGLLTRGGDLLIENYSFTLFLFACGLIAVTGLYLVQMPIHPNRLLTFGFLFGFPALVFDILRWTRNWLQRGGVVLLITFMLLNILWIEPTAWDPGATGVAAATSRQDYALAQRFDFSDGTVAGHQNTVMAIYHLHKRRGTRLTASSQVNLETYDWVVVQKDFLGLELTLHDPPPPDMIAQLQRLVQEGSSSKNRIYESTALAVFKQRGNHW